MRQRQRLLVHVMMLVLVLLTAIPAMAQLVFADATGGTAVSPASTPTSSPSSGATTSTPALFAGSPYPMSASGWVFPLYPLSHVAR